MRHTYAQLAAGFGVGTTTVYRYVAEAVELLAALAPDLATAPCGGTEGVSDPRRKASPALPGAVHDIRAARIHGVTDALAGAGIRCWADQG